MNITIQEKLEIRNINILYESDSYDVSIETPLRDNIDISLNEGKVSAIDTAHRENTENPHNVTKEQLGITGDAGSFEKINKNLKSLNATPLNQNQIRYSNGILKTLTQPNDDTVVITLSGNTPNGIDLVKTVEVVENKDFPKITYS